MRATGMIFAALDCDADAIEGWNRWYDLEHLPPNVALDGIMYGNRYVATPALHELRRPGAALAFADGRASFLTIYTLASDVAGVFADMTEYRERLVEADRMFPDDKKVVRLGDGLDLTWAVADPALKADEGDIPHLCHTAIHVALARGGADHYHEAWAPAAVEVPGVSAVLGLTSRYQEGQPVLMVHLLDGEPAEVVPALRGAVAHAPGAEVLVEGPWSLITPLHYPWAETIRSSWLPQTVQ